MIFRTLISALLISFFTVSGAPAVAKPYSTTQKLGCVAAVLGAATVATAWHGYADACRVQNQSPTIDGFLSYSWAEFKNAHLLTVQKTTTAKLLLGAEALAAAAVVSFLQADKQQVEEKNAQVSFKLMSSNVLGEIAYGNWVKDPTLKVDFKKRAAKFGQVIEDEHPDLIGFQEVDPPWQAVFKERLAHDYEVVFAPGNLSIYYKKTLFRPIGKKYFNKEARVLSQTFKYLPSGQRFVVINIHAPWGQGQNYENIYQNAINLAQGLPILALGDWNTDGEPDKNNNKAILEGLFIGGSNRFKDFTAGLPHTARSVHNNQAEKIDYITARKFTVVRSVRCEPPTVEHLLPHAQGGMFDLEDGKNHFSDHAALIVDVQIAAA